MTHASPESAAVPGTGPIRVAAGIITDNGRYLIARRPIGSHLGGLWEFPGGKCEPGETVEACLHRELWEELAVRIDEPVHMCVLLHEYIDKAVELHFFYCRIVEGEAQPLGGSELRWVTPGELSQYEFPPADRSVISTLQHGDWPQ